MISAMKPPFCAVSAAAAGFLCAALSATREARAEMRLTTIVPCETNDSSSTELWALSAAMAALPRLGTTTDASGTDFLLGWSIPLVCAGAMTSRALTYEDTCGGSRPPGATCDPVAGEVPVGSYAHRLVVEPSWAPWGARGQLRGAYRYTMRGAPNDGPLGVSGSLGSTIDFSGALTRLSLSPELSGHVSIIVLVVRFDRYFAGPDRNALTFLGGAGF
jgi:hypothetical protein